MFNRGRVPSNTETVGRIAPRGCKDHKRDVRMEEQTVPASSPPLYATAGAFFRSSPDVSVPDLQIGLCHRSRRRSCTQSSNMGHGISCHVEVLRPYSRGNCEAQQQTIRAIRYNRSAILVRRTRYEAITQGSASSAAPSSNPKTFDSMRGKMLYPTRIDDPAGMERDIRNRADTQYHPVGTCKMGPQSDPMAVVDARLRVKGHRLSASSGCLDHAHGGRGVR